MWSRACVQDLAILFSLEPCASVFSPIMFTRERQSICNSVMLFPEKKEAWPLCALLLASFFVQKTRLLILFCGLSSFRTSIRTRFQGCASLFKPLDAGSCTSSLSFNAEFRIFSFSRVWKEGLHVYPPPPPLPSSITIEVCI